MEEVIIKEKDTINPSTANDGKENVQLIKKIDWKVLPVLCGFYFFQQMDKSNIGSVKSDGTTTTEAAIFVDTNTVGGNAYLFNLALSIFFLGYILAEFPLTFFLQKFKLNQFLSVIGVAWGLCTLLIGFTRDPVTLIVCRFFLGFFEAGVLPASVLITGIHINMHNIIFFIFKY